jgi:hypothetical protein
MAHPHFDTPTAITRQAVKRYRMARGELEYEVTPSYDAGFVPPAGGAREVATTPAKKAPPKKAPAKGKELTAAQINQIKNAKGFFPDEKIAQMYGITVAQVQLIQSG